MSRRQATSTLKLVWNISQSAYLKDPFEELFSFGGGRANKLTYRGSQSIYCFQLDEATLCGPIIPRFFLALVWLCVNSSVNIIWYFIRWIFQFLPCWCNRWSIFFRSREIERKKTKHSTLFSFFSRNNKCSLADEKTWMRYLLAAVCGSCRIVL